MRSSKILIAFLAIMSFCSCSDNTKQEKNLLNDILKVHDKIMSKDEVLMRNKSQLDSLLKIKKTDTAENVNIRGIDLKLKAAEEAMENWMMKFQPDVSNKSHDEVMKYYTDQKKQVTAVDSQVNVAVKESNDYLSNHKIK